MPTHITLIRVGDTHTHIRADIAERFGVRQNDRVGPELWEAMVAEQAGVGKSPARTWLARLLPGWSGR